MKSQRELAKTWLSLGHADPTDVTFPQDSHNGPDRCPADGNAQPIFTRSGGENARSEDVDLDAEIRTTSCYDPSYFLSRKLSNDRRDLVPKSLEQSKRRQRPLQPVSGNNPRSRSQRRGGLQVPTEPTDHAANMSSSVHSRTTTHGSRSASPASHQTSATSLPPLQHQGLEENDKLEPLNDADLNPGSFDLVAPPDAGPKKYSLETRSDQLFSTEHLEMIFSDPSLLLRFTAFLSSSRPLSIPILIYYLDGVKALKAISYSNAIAEALDPIDGFDFTKITANPTVNADLEEKSRRAFEVLVREDLPAYITHTYTQTVSLSIQRRITGTLPAHLREASEGLAEVFCLTDPSRPDNPIVFASEEFHRTTQYGMTYAIGRNCRFLQGPKTNPFSVRRIREKIEAGQEHCEVILNYRRDGSPFMNLLMCAPLCDSRGAIRYFIGAQVDVSGLVKESSDLESLQRLVTKSEELLNREDLSDRENEEDALQKDEFQELSEMLNLTELDTVRKWGGRMHKESYEEIQDTNFNNVNWKKPRLLISSISPDGSKEVQKGSGRLSGIYENYLLIRPYPSLRVLFASPTLRVPGILQSPFMNKIGGSSRVREELTQALADGRGVTAKVRWISKTDPDGRSRWIHCTPLLGSNGAIGVWMVVIVDDENQSSKSFRQAPSVDPKFGRTVPFTTAKDDASLKDFAMSSRSRSRQMGKDNGSLNSFSAGTERSGSPYTLRID